VTKVDKHHRVSAVVGGDDLARGKPETDLRVSLAFTGIEL